MNFHHEKKLVILFPINRISFRQILELEKTPGMNKFWIFC